MVVVPRLFEMLRARILKTLEKSGGLSNYLLNRALTIGADRYDGRFKPWDLPMDGILSLTFGARSAPSSAGGSRRWCRAARRSIRRSACSSTRSA